MAKNLFNEAQANTMTAKVLRTAKSETKRANHESFKDYQKALEGAFRMLVKSDNPKSRNCANRCKGVFKTEIAILANCYPYQNNDGELMRYKETKNNEGAKVKTWDYLTLTASNVRGILEKSIKNYIDSLYMDNYTMIYRVEKGNTISPKELKKLHK